MATDPTNLAVWKMIGFYIVWNLSTRSDHMLKSRQCPAQQSFGDHAANDWSEPKVTNAAAAQNGGFLLHADVQEIKKGQWVNPLRALIYEAAL